MCKRERSFNWLATASVERLTVPFLIRKVPDNFLDMEAGSPNLNVDQFLKTNVITANSDKPLIASFQFTSSLLLTNFLPVDAI